MALKGISHRSISDLQGLSFYRKLARKVSRANKKPCYVLKQGNNYTVLVADSVVPEGWTVVAIEERIKSTKDVRSIEP